MAEHDVGWNLVNARPPDLAIVLRECRKLLDFGAIHSDLRVALHAAGGGANTHSLAWIGIRMALAALQFQLPGVHFVTEGDWLLRWWRGLLGSLRQDGYGTSRHEAELAKNPH